MAKAKTRSTTKKKTATSKKRATKRSAGKADKKRKAGKGGPKNGARNSSEKSSRTSRSKNPMPAAVRRALVARGLLRAYEERPEFQQNDYLWWIGSAKRDSTREKRLEQMLDELENGKLYMNMPWRPLSR